MGILIPKHTLRTLDLYALKKGKPYEYTKFYLRKSRSNTFIWGKDNPNNAFSFIYF
jgi:hypothetical protein